MIIQLKDTFVLKLLIEPSKLLTILYKSLNIFKNRLCFDEELEIRLILL